MEADSESADPAGAVRSERRRRRRRSAKKKNDDAGAELALLLRLARWAVGCIAMIAIWGYGFYVVDKLGWGAAIFFPAGIVAMLCIASALAIPFITFLAVIVAFLMRIDSGLLVGLRNAGIVFIGVGALHRIWRLFVFLIVKREVTRNEAGYK
jgi:hypothetical protein